MFIIKHLRLAIDTNTMIKNSLSLAPSLTHTRRSLVTHVCMQANFAIILICQYFTMAFLRDLLIEFGNTNYGRAV